MNVRGTKAEEWPEWKFEIRVLLNAAEVMDVVFEKEKMPAQASFTVESDYIIKPH